MAERFTSDLVFILIALLVTAILGIIIGYLFRRIRNARFAALEAEKEKIRIKLDDSEKQVKLLNFQLEDCGKQLKQCNEKKQAEKAGFFDAEAARSAFKTRIIENDLKIVEGIGGKIAELLRKRGINSWLELSKTTPEMLKEILLADGGPSYRIHDPATWPQQALMAYDGKWNELKELQQQLTAGRQN